MSASDGGDSGIPLVPTAFLPLSGDQSFGEFIKKPANFARAVLGVVLGFLVESAFSVAEIVIESINAAVNAVLLAVFGVRLSLVDALAPVESAIIGTVTSLTTAVTGAVEATGPLAPVVGVALAVGTAYVTYRLLETLLASLPGIGTVLDRVLP